MAAYTPQTAAEWKDLGQLWLGALAGWFSSPGIWFAVWGPRRFWALLSATAFCESRFQKSIVNIDEGAEGLLQYLESTWDDLYPDEATRPLRGDPRAQGYAAALYIRDRTIGKWGWLWRMAVPLYGYAAFRWTWTHAPSDTFPSWDEMVTFAKEEQDGECWAAMRWWNLWTLLIAWAGFIIPVLSGYGWIRWGRGK